MKDLSARLAEELRSAGVAEVAWAVVLGSGLSGLTERMQVRARIPFTALPSMPGSKVPGHAGEFVYGTLGGAATLAQSGRVHLYEGWPVESVVRSVRAFACLGAKSLLLTNAAGGIRADWAPGTLMVVLDHLNLQWRKPRTSERADRGPYSAGVLDALRAAAGARSIPHEEGIYAGMLGPGYETPAEIRMLHSLGADAVGMSTVCEATAAWGAGLPVGAVSCITNPAAGIARGPLNHEEVVEAGRRAGARFCDLLEGYARAASEGC